MPSNPDNRPIAVTRDDEVGFGRGHGRGDHGPERMPIEHHWALPTAYEPAAQVPDVVGDQRDIGPAGRATVSAKIKEPGIP